VKTGFGFVSRERDEGEDRYWFPRVNLVPN